MKLLVGVVLMLAVLGGFSGATPLADAQVGLTQTPGLPRLSAVPLPDGVATVPLPVEFVRSTDDGQVLVVRAFYLGLCQRLLGVHVDTNESAVHVVGVASPLPGVPCPLALHGGEYEVALDTPLGKRTVISRKGN